MTRRQRTIIQSTFYRMHHVQWDAEGRCDIHASITGNHILSYHKSYGWGLPTTLTAEQRRNLEPALLSELQAHAMSVMPPSLRTPDEKTPLPTPVPRPTDTTAGGGVLVAILLSDSQVDCLKYAFQIMVMSASPWTHSVDPTLQEHVKKCVTAMWLIDSILKQADK